MGKKSVPWDHMVDCESAKLHFSFRDPEIAADTAARLRNLGLVVMEHRRPEPRDATKLWRMSLNH